MPPTLPRIYDVLTLKGPKRNLSTPMGEFILVQGATKIFTQTKSEMSYELFELFALFFGYNVFNTVFNVFPCAPLEAFFLLYYFLDLTFSRNFF